jgi:hypothetical protein
MADSLVTLSSNYYSAHTQGITTLAPPCCLCVRLHHTHAQWCTAAASCSKVFAHHADVDTPSARAGPYHHRWCGSISSFQGDSHIASTVTRTSWMSMRPTQCVRYHFSAHVRI